ncbi:DUF4340 domain-containing protein [Pseudobutyrivibrio xylanivorans]|uniref:DUF4340 domain-containing protein n=1 Tax=Pseudobutyrivibrio xylanivorans DSM 14809 TaxID=1123012 RepID=A0A1M6I9M0_PSEXY|nr:DUF4340 domain-containing protein [Pseudobutyrivibrio xylanivorans]SHJ31130.1 protein of unknown function [Pseudobutyrivibrio xylanivorans DSM 14809]
MEAFFKSKKFKIALLILALLIICFLGIIYRIYQVNSKNPPLGLINPDEDPVTVETSHAEKLDKKSTDKDKGDQIIYMEKDEVYSFSFPDSNGIILGFEKEDGKWVYPDDPDIEINQDRVDKILNYLCDIHCVEYIEDANGEDYGLDQNSKTFTIQDSAGDTIIISINNDSEDGNVYFAINYDFTTIFINSGKLGNVCEYAIQDLIKL